MIPYERFLSDINKYLFQPHKTLYRDRDRLGVPWMALDQNMSLLCASKKRRSSLPSGCIITAVYILETATYFKITSNQRIIFELDDSHENNNKARLSDHVNPDQGLTRCTKPLDNSLIMPEIIDHDYQDIIIMKGRRYKRIVPFYPFLDKYAGGCCDIEIESSEDDNHNDDLIYTYYEGMFTRNRYVSRIYSKSDVLAFPTDNIIPNPILFENLPILIDYIGMYDKKIFNINCLETEKLRTYFKDEPELQESKKIQLDCYENNIELDNDIVISEFILKEIDSFQIIQTYEDKQTVLFDLKTFYNYTIRHLDIKDTKCVTIKPVYPVLIPRLFRGKISINFRGSLFPSIYMNTSIDTCQIKVPVVILYPPRIPPRLYKLENGIANPMYYDNSLFFEKEWKLTFPKIKYKKIFDDSLFEIENRCVGKLPDEFKDMEILEWKGKKVIGYAGDKFVKGLY